MKINTLALATLILLGIVLFYSSVQPKAYPLKQWVPVDLLKTIGVPTQLIKLVITKIYLVAHFLGAYTVTLLLLLSFKGMLHKSFFSQIILLITMTFLFFAVELIQTLIGRGFSLIDILAGSTGSLVSIICFSLLAKTNISKA